MEEIKKATEAILQIARKYGARAGIARAQALADEQAALEKTLQKGIPDTVKYLARTPQKRADIRQWFPPAKSVLMCAFQYWNKNTGKNLVLSADDITELLKKRKTDPALHPNNLGYTGKSFKTARYFSVADYHVVLQDKLNKILAEIKEIYPQTEGKVFSDSASVMEKPLAQKSGLGIIGRNGLLIDKKAGSFFFLGGIALNLELEPSAPITDFSPCQNCGLCRRNCPTGAISDKGVNINLCLSAWKRLKKENVPPAVAKHLENIALGCDICQEACPYNRNAGEPIIPELSPLWNAGVLYRH